MLIDLHTKKQFSVERDLDAFEKSIYSGQPMQFAHADLV